MKLKDIIVAGLVIVVLIVLWLFISEKKRAEYLDKIVNKLSKENEMLKEAYLNLLEDYLTIEEKVAPDIILELQKLKSQIDHLETSIHVELESVIHHVNNGKGSKAVKDLAKVVENQLKQKVNTDSNFKKKPTLHNLLEYAKECQWIEPHQHAFGHFIKAIRNRESHELAVKEPGCSVGLAIFAGIEIIYTLKQ